MFEVFLIAAVITTFVVNVGYLIVDRRQKTKFASTTSSKLAKQKCTGYQDPFIKSLRDDCKAHRSIECKDGRCSFHCKSNCKCEDLDVPQFDKFIKKNVN